MSEQIKDGGPAFPLHPGINPDWGHCNGMSLRDYFAGQALVSMGTWSPSLPDGSYPNGRQEIQVMKARWAYDMADAMLAIRSEHREV